MLFSSLVRIYSSKIKPHNLRKMICYIITRKKAPAETNILFIVFLWSHDMLCAPWRVVTSTPLDSGWPFTCSATSIIIYFSSALYLHQVIQQGEAIQYWLLTYIYYTLGLWPWLKFGCAISSGLSVPFIYFIYEY